MKFKSALITQASGSIQGMTFSRNKGGAYIRGRSIPTNPGTPSQSLVRNLMSQLSNAWGNDLDADQRASWANYADNVPLVDTLGEARKVTALNMFVRSNLPREQSGRARITDAPTIFNLGAFSEPSVAGLVALAGSVTIAFDNTDEWATEVGASMLIYASEGQSPTTEYFKGPYKFAGRINGAAVPPTSPATITLPSTIAAGQQCFFRAIVTRADGRLSTEYRFRGSAA